MSKKWTIASMLLLLLVVGGIIMTGIAYLQSSSQQTVTESTSQPETSKETQQPSYAVSRSSTVTYTDKGFSPASVTVAKGTTVAFDNQTEIPMWVASDPHPEHTNYPELDVMRVSNQYPEPRNDYSFTFDKTGTWTYHNHAMPDHTAKITVTD